MISERSVGPWRVARISRLSVGVGVSGWRLSLTLPPPPISGDSYHCRHAPPPRRHSQLHSIRRRMGSRCLLAAPVSHTLRICVRTRCSNYWLFAPRAGSSLPAEIWHSRPRAVPLDRNKTLMS